MSQEPEDRDVTEPAVVGEAQHDEGADDIPNCQPEQPSALAEEGTRAQESAPPTKLSRQGADQRTRKAPALPIIPEHHEAALPTEDGPEQQDSVAHAAEPDQVQMQLELSLPAEPGPESPPGYTIGSEAEVQARLAACMDGTPAQPAARHDASMASCTPAAAMPAAEGRSIWAVGTTPAAGPSGQSDGQQDGQHLSRAAGVTPAALEESDVMGFSPGTSDKHCLQAQQPVVKRAAKRKRRSEANWCAEAANELIGFGRQMTADSCAQRKPASLKRTASMVERIKPQLESRKAQKAAERTTPNQAPASASTDWRRAAQAAADNGGRSPAPSGNDVLPAKAHSGGKPSTHSGSESDASRVSPPASGNSAEAWDALKAERQGPPPSTSKTLQQGDEVDRSDGPAPENSKDAWVHMTAKGQQPQPSQTETLQQGAGSEANNSAGAAPESMPGEPEQPERAPPPQKEISPSLMRRRSARGVIAAEAMVSPQAAEKLPAGGKSGCRQATSFYIQNSKSASMP